jgi:methionine sulfoxide reductase heme-binding subunit
MGGISVWIRRLPLALGLVASLLAVEAGLAASPDWIEGWRLAARWTARVGFPIFILTYSASSLLRLWPNALTKALVRDRRLWGLGFAASHTVHLAALIFFLQLIGEPPLLVTLLGGGLAYALLYAMALTSSNAAQRALGRNWKRLHTAGIHWLWAVFVFTYGGRVAAGEEMPYAGICVAVAFAALGLRIAASIMARRKSLT